MTLPLVHGSRVKCLDCAPVAAPPMAPVNPLVSDTGELRWRTGQGTSTLSVDAPRSQALVGFVRDANGATTHLAADIGNGFAAITASALDGKPIRTSDRLLVTATAKAGNSGQGWNARHTMLDKWGTAPTWIEPVKGWLLLKDLDGALGVVATPLDGAGRPAGPDIKGRMLESGWEIPVGTPASTSYLVRVLR
jgi:hypothetical protein